MSDIPCFRIGKCGLNRLAERHAIIIGIAHPGRMRQQHAQRHFGIGKPRIAEPPAEIVRGVAIQIECPRLNHPHDAQRDDEFRDAGNPHRIIDRHAAFGRTVGKAGCLNTGKRRGIKPHTHPRFGPGTGRDEHQNNKDYRAHTRHSARTRRARQGAALRLLTLAICKKCDEIPK